MASLQGNTIKDTYKSLLKVADNGELEATEQEITDGNGNGTGVSLNTSGDVTATGTVAFGSLKDSGENITITKFVDEADGIANNDNDTSIPTSAAVKDYVDTNITAQDLDITDGTNVGAVDLDSQLLTFTGAGTVSTNVSGQTVTITGAGTDLSNTPSANDVVVESSDGNNTTLGAATTSAAGVMTSADKTKLNGIETGAEVNPDASEVKSLYESNADTNAFTDAQLNKLNGIESGAEVNSTASEVKTLYESNADTNAFTDADQTKLGTIESGAEVNPDAAEVKSLYESNANTNAFTDAEQTKLGNIESGAQVNTVDSVNTQTGAVVLDADDIDDSTTTNKFTTQVEIDKLAGIESGAEVNAVDSVNGETGVVVLDADDISDTSTTNKFVTSTEITKLGNITVTQAVNLDTLESDVATNNAKNSYPSGDATKVGFISVTQAVNLDTIESDTATNNAKISFDSTSSSKLAGIEENADVTDATNVAAAGAMMTGVAVLNDLFDVSGTPSDGQVLTYDTLNGWQPETAASAPVTSVNSETGAVVLDADDISDATTTNKFTTQTDIDKLAGIESGAEVNTVDSVNTQTGAVVLDADDIDDSTTTNKFTSQTDIDKLAGIESGAEVNTVDSVNGETGVVVLDADDIDDTSTTHKFTTQTDIDKLAGIEAGAEVNDIDGSGTANNVAKWSDADTITDSVIYDDGTNVGIGTSSPIAITNGLGLTIGNSSTQHQPYLSLSRNRLGGYFAGVQILNEGSISSYMQEDGDGNLRFGTANTERMRIDSSGNVEITSGNIEFANGSGIDFSASAGGGATSSLLDDYEEGTFTPLWRRSSTQPTATYATQIGSYTKVGNLVYVTVRLDTTSISGGSGNLSIGGLPFVAASGSFFPAASIGFKDSFVTTGPDYGRFTSGLSQIELYSDDNTDEILITLSNIGASTKIIVSGCYQV